MVPCGWSSGKSGWDKEARGMRWFAAPGGGQDEASGEEMGCGECGSFWVGWWLLVHRGWSWGKGRWDEERWWSGRGGRGCGRDEMADGTRRLAAAGWSFWRWVGGWWCIVSGCGEEAGRGEGGERCGRDEEIGGTRRRWGRGGGRDEAGGTRNLAGREDGLWFMGRSVGGAVGGALCYGWSIVGGRGDGEVGGCCCGGWAVGGPLWVVVGKRRPDEEHVGGTRRWAARGARGRHEEVGGTRRAGQGCGRDEQVGGGWWVVVVGGCIENHSLKVKLSNFRLWRWSRQLCMIIWSGEM